MTHSDYSQRDVNEEHWWQPKVCTRKPRGMGRARPHPRNPDQRPMALPRFQTQMKIDNRQTAGSWSPRPNPDCASNQQEVDWRASPQATEAKTKRMMPLIKTFLRRADRQRAADQQKCGRSGRTNLQTTGSGWWTLEAGLDGRDGQIRRRASRKAMPEARIGGNKIHLPVLDLRVTCCMKEL